MSSGYTVITSNVESDWTRSRLDQIYILCSGGSSQDCWGAASHTASPTAQGAPGRLDSPAWRRGHEYSQTCVYKEDIKICTVASFQCLKVAESHQFKVCKKFVCQKTRKKKSLPWQQCIRSPSETSRHGCSTPTPNRWRTQPWACAPRAQPFSMASLRLKRMPVKLVTLYVYKYMYMYL